MNRNIAVTNACVHVLSSYDRRVNWSPDRHGMFDMIDWRLMAKLIEISVK